MLRIVVAGDSLAWPRLGPSPVYGTDVWPTLLESELCQAGLSVRVLNHSKQGRTLPDLVRDCASVVELWLPDWVIVQVGIVDCAPRVFDRWQRELMNMPGFPSILRRALVKFAAVNRARITRLRPHVRYTSPTAFRDAILQLAGCLTRVCGRNVIVLPILETVPTHAQRSAGYNEVVRQYNELWQLGCLQHGWRFVSHESVVRRQPLGTLLLEDGHHISAAGHATFAQLLLGMFKGCALGDTGSTLSWAREATPNRLVGTVAPTGHTS